MTSYREQGVLRLSHLLRGRLRCRRLPAVLLLLLMVHGHSWGRHLWPRAVLRSSLLRLLRLLCCPVPRLPLRRLVLLRRRVHMRHVLLLLHGVLHRAGLRLRALVLLLRHRAAAGARFMLQVALMRRLQYIKNIGRFRRVRWTHRHQRCVQRHQARPYSALRG